MGPTLIDIPNCIHNHGKIKYGDREVVKYYRVTEGSTISPLVKALDKQVY